MRLTRRLVLLLSLPVCWSAVSAQPTAETVLQKYRQRFGTVEYAGRESIEERQTDGALVQVWSEWKVRPGRERSDFVDGAEAYRGLTQVDDGSKLTIHVPVEHRAYRYPSVAQQASKRQQKQVKDLQERYDAVMVGKEAVAKRATWHLRLQPKDGQTGPVVDVWIDGQQWVALRQEAHSGSVVWRRRCFDRIDFKPELADDAFEYQPPQGTQVIDLSRRPAEGQKGRVEAFRLSTAYEVHQRFGVRVMQPRWVPDGFSLAAFLVHPPAPGVGVFQRRISAKYSQQQSVIMLTQGGAAPRKQKKSERPQQPAEIKPGMLFWVKHGIRLLLIGPRGMDSSDLQRCARSVNWYDAGGGDGGRCSQASLQHLPLPSSDAAATQVISWRW